MKHMLVPGRNTQGFALPTILIASVIMLIVLVTAVTAVGSVSTALSDQYYNELAREAAESGLANASICLQAGNFVPTWTNAKPLHSNTDCTGTTQAGWDANVLNSGNVRTSFSVAQPVVGTASSLRIVSVGTVQLVRSSNSSLVWRTYTDTAVKNSRYNDTPQIAGGAGYKLSGHNGYMLATSGTLYGWGDNTGNQLGDPSQNLPSNVTNPIALTLPPNVTTVKKVYNSGEGASILCILATSSVTRDQVYCRGTGNMMNGATTWVQFGLTAGLTATDAVVQGYGGDSMCVIASDSQAYCAGINDSGELGTTTTSAAAVPLSSPVKFRLDLANPGPVSGSASSLTVKRVFNQDRFTCVVASDNQAYCAGDNNLGQLGRGNVSTNVWIGNSVPGRVLVSGAPTVSDLRTSYHGGIEAIYILTANGDVFMSGSSKCGTANDGTSSTACASTNVGSITSYSTPRQLTSGTFGYIMSVGEAASERNAFCTIGTVASGNSGLWCLGTNAFGELGTGSCTDTTTWSLIGVNNTSGISQQVNWLLNAQAGYQMNSVTVITLAGDAYSAGDNTYGKLGTGATMGVACNSTFKKVLLPSGIQAVAVANGDEYTTFILGSDGNVYAMGRNNNGQLGNGTTTDSAVPVRVNLPRQETVY